MTEPPDAWNNGLLASSYVPLTDVAATVAPQLLSALSRARIAAYLAEAPGSHGALRLYVASSERSDARTIVARVVRANGGEPPLDAAGSGDPLAGIDAEAEFAALIADWHVDTHHAIRDAERELSREDEDWRARLNQDDPVDDELTWLDEGHYVPPTPPPLPRPTAPIVLGMVLVVVSILLFAFGDPLGIPFTLSLFLGVCGIITALVLFVMRLREYRDDDDDGAVL
ncbi:MAG TPA: hypothetical protein VGH43_16435 [Jatrophihabitans sp.]|jgi:hypothetical protein